jgi:hypothetical protein
LKVGFTVDRVFRFFRYLRQKSDQISNDKKSTGKRLISVRLTSVLHNLETLRHQGWINLSLKDEGPTTLRAATRLYDKQQQLRQRYGTTDANAIALQTRSRGGNAKGRYRGNHTNLIPGYSDEDSDPYSKYESKYTKSRKKYGFQEKSGRNNDDFSDDEDRDGDDNLGNSPGAVLDDDLFSQGPDRTHQKMKASSKPKKKEAPKEAEVNLKDPMAELFAVFEGEKKEGSSAAESPIFKKMLEKASPK